ncbi:hypothetical protein OBBRIDRAFT_787081 [Obba rivulosa]|uniref:INO80 complex subunit B-like conserved region domain-containing protein n=1 Tax=Obba rivulosa TaxID=1052685 RepID=A0A8E2DVV8_9APHY|nr:hypothetical protein OBBRIDRAFT_787081 [Obba rivulosa]
MPPRRRIISEERDDSEASDMQMSQSDVDVEGNGDKSEQGEEEVEEAVDVQDEDVEVEEDEEEEDEEPEAEEGSEIDELSSPPQEQQDDSAIPPRLRIKLKLPQASASSSGAPTGVSTPEEIGHPSSRRAVPRDIDIESEDEDDDDDADSSRSTSVGTSAAGRPLTARQAVLANVVGSSHVSLAEAPNPRKKKPLTEIEIALKREETARKRKNLSEKKLEDEKAETINRLLKKQSRSKGKRNALSTADDRPLMSANVADADVEDMAESVVPTPVMPTMYRWISTSRPKADSKMEEAHEEKHMELLFSVPVNALSPPVDALRSDAMDVDALQRESKAQCDVEGCGAQRKYRLVKNWQRGACGISHLKLLETQLG